MKKTLLITALAFSGFANANLIVTDSNDGTVLANNILGSGVTINNVNVIGNSNQSGTFTNGLSGGIGIDSGILLTSGSAQTAAQNNTADNISITAGTGGNAALTALVGTGTNDQNVLSFDFFTTTGDLFFDYVFASDEYNEFVNSSFNDVFALFVDGVNIAIAPDGQEVSVNTVNCGNPLNGVGPNCASFNNNDTSDGGPFFDIQYDGFTDVLTAQALGLGIGQHTFTLAIADTNDSAYDSAVFIKEGSFTDTNPVPEPATLALFGAGLFGLGYARRRKQK